MKNKRIAISIIAANLQQIEELIKNCENIAINNKIDFSFDTPCGRIEQFDGTGEYNEGVPLKWDQSQC